MFAGLNSDLSSSVDNFYSPISASGYLTPLQRKKLREKRKIDISELFEREFVTPKNPKRLLHQNNKPQFKAKSKKTLFNKKPKSIPSASRCISSDLLVSINSESITKDRKFFKSRSPQHLKKAKFSMPLTYKKKSLNFGSPVVNNSKPVIDVPQDVFESEIVSIHSEKVQQSVVTSPEAMSNKTTCPVLKDAVKIAKFSTPKAKNVLANTSNVLQNVENDSNSKLTIKNKVEVCEKGIFDFDWPSDEDLLKRQRRARSLMKRANPPVCDQESKENVEGTQSVTPPKLYPIFLKGKCNKKEPETERPCLKKSPTFIKESSTGGEQMFIDAGQKEIGAKCCPTCNMVYTIAQEEDENLHAKYHETYLINLKFLGWKDEHVVGNYDDGRIIVIKETDKHFKLKKVQDVLFIANRDLGFSSASYPSKPNVMFFLFISNEKRVCGCLVAESIESACPVVLGNEVDGSTQEVEKTIWELGNWYASNNPVPAMCGVNRIWVSKNSRRCKVGSRMLDCLRHNFLFGHVVSFQELAFTDPSSDGRQFAASYTKTNNFLVYK